MFNGNGQIWDISKKYSNWISLVVCAWEVMRERNQFYLLYLQCVHVGTADHG